MTIKQTKAALRQDLKQLRLEMLDEEHRLASLRIVERLKTAADWQAVRSLHYFEPIQELLEPAISDLVRYLEDAYPAMELFTSRVIRGNWEIITSRGGQPAEQFDVIIVPMLGFDPGTLHRIGYGGGYYDRLLADQPAARKIGVCFEAGRLDHLPSEPHDIPLDLVVTESTNYTK